jgi:hypothetical protein
MRPMNTDRSRLRRFSRMAVIGVVTTLGCARLLGLRDDVPGDQCAANSECPPSKNCVFSVCSPTCKVDNDCALGSRCLRTQAATVCVPSQRAACNADGLQLSCPEGTSCGADLSCRNVCDPACSSDQICSGRFCVGTDPSHDGFTRPEDDAGDPVDATVLPGSGGSGSGGADNRGGGSSDCSDAGFESSDAFAVDSGDLGADARASLPLTCRSCTPGTKRCSDNHPQICDGSGHFGTGLECAQPAPSCVSGACVCPVGSAVSNGVCCPHSQTGCGGACADLQTDANNCGGCRLVCGTPGTTAVRCQGGSCIETCSANSENCNGAAGDGCECLGNGCCGSNCQTEHSNGIKQFFYDCNPPRTYTLAAAIAACTRFTGNPSLCASCSDLTSWGVSVVQQTIYGPVEATWVWATGSLLKPGSAVLLTNFDCSNGGSTTQCHTTCNGVHSDPTVWD